MFGRRERLDVRSPDELRGMRRAGLVVAQTLTVLREACRPGTTTLDLDRLAEREIRARGAVPSFPEVPGYRHTLCVSVGDEVVHGIPRDRVLTEGDVVSIDCGAHLEGWHGDSAVTVIVGGPEAADDAAVQLSEATRASLWAGIAAFRRGGRVADVGAAVEEEIAAAAQRDGRAYGIVDGFEGHGIGRAMHMEPSVPNVRTRGHSPRIRAGAAVAIEPMVTLGAEDTVELEDGWTAVTVDGSLAAHWEHTVAATSDGIWVLTALDGGEAELASLGAPFGPLD